MLKEQYYQIGCATQADARSVSQKLSADKKRVPIGIYDAKTELFEWEPGRQLHYDQAGIEDQGRWGTEVIAMVQALRRRDASWHPSAGFQRPSFFA